MIADACNTFGFELWRRLDPGNLAMSPTSIAATLAMVSLGARGETGAEMRAVLHLDGGSDIAAGWRELATALRSSDPALRLFLANRLFGAQRYPFDRGFIDGLARGFGAELEPIDVADAEAARQRINRWVAEHTDGKIADLLAPGSISADTRLVLANAIYFFGAWQEPFRKERTMHGPFWTSATQSKLAPMMMRTYQFRLSETAGAAMLELPYHDGRHAMYIVLPHERDGLAEVERSFDAATFATLRDSARERLVAVELPRFTIALPSALRLDGILRALGMPLAFDRERADFSAMAPQSGEPLWISTVAHQAFVAVDELGTTATAATAAVMLVGGPPPKPRPFVADHPFLFLIAEKRSGAILFIGRVVDPTG